MVWCIEAAGGSRFCQLGLHFLDLSDEQRSEIDTFVGGPMVLFVEAGKRDLRTMA